MIRPRSAVRALAVGLLLAPAAPRGMGSPEGAALVRPARLEAAARHGAGELRVLEGVPFLRLAGSYREMGLDYGALLKDRIRALLDATGVPELARRRSWFEGWMLRQRLPRRDLDLIEGIADGAGLPRDELLWLNFAMPGGCSSVLVRTGEGLLHGHNQDRPQAGRFKVVVEFAPAGAYRYVLTSYAGTIDALEGMNEKGISLTQDAASSRPTLLGASPYFVRNRDILESAASLKEVRAILASRRGDTAILVVASAADGSGAAYDLAGGRVHETALGARPLVATNTHLTPALGEHPEECPRFTSLRARLDGAPLAGARELSRILGDAAGLRGTNNESTVHSLVLDPARRTLYMAFGPAFAAWGRWLRYDWPAGEVTVFAEPALDLTGHAVRLEDLPPHRAARVRAIVPSIEAQGPLWDALEKGLEADGVPAIAAGCVTYQGAGASGVDLELQVAVAPRARGGKHLTIVDVPASRVAATIHQGPRAALPEAYRAVRRWIAASGYVEAGPPTECFLKGAGAERDPAYRLTEVRIPIAPARARP